MTLFRYFLYLLPLLLFTACATIPTPSLEYDQDAKVETLSSAVSLSVRTPDFAISGSGYMVYRRPDQIHLVVLSPFGTTLMEVFALGEKITLVYPSRSFAYVGTFNELPEVGGLQGWRMMRWVMDADPAADKQFNGVVERVSKLGLTESVTFEKGLVVSKTMPRGDRVLYGKYAAINGVPVAAQIDMRNERDDRILIKLDEPEINTTLDDAVFVPRLDGMKVLPLSSLKGL